MPGERNIYFNVSLNVMEPPARLFSITEEQ